METPATTSLETPSSSVEYLNTSNYSYPNVTLPKERRGNSTFQEEIVFRIILHCILYPIVIVTGIIGNALTLKIFARKEKSVRKMFILSLTATDLCLLCTNIPVVIHAYMFVIDSGFLRTIDIPFELLMLLSRFPDRLGKLLTVGMTAERFTAVFFPLRFKQIWSRKTGSVCILCIVLFVSVTNIPLFTDVFYFYFTYSPKEDEQEAWGSIYKYYFAHHQKSWANVLFILNRIIFDFACIAAAFILSVATAVGIKKLLNPNMLKFSTTEMIQRKRREKKITKTLMAISLSLCLLNAPNFISFILTEVEVFKMLSFATASSLIFLIVINSAINFAIFGVSDNSLREEYLQAWKCCRQVQPPPQSDGQKSVNTSQKAL